MEVLGKLNGKILTENDKKVPTTLTKTLNLESPTVLDKVVFMRIESISDISFIYAVLEGASSPSVTFTLKYATDKNAVGTTLVSSVSVTNITNGVSLTLTNNTNIPAGSWVWVEISAVSGAVSNLILDINYNVK